MELTLVHFVVFGVIALIIVGAMLYAIFSLSAGDDKEEALYALIQTQKKHSEVGQIAGKEKDTQKGDAAILAAATAGELKKTKNLGRLSLANKIYYARWKISPVQFRVLKYCITLIVVGGIYPFVKSPIIVMSAFMVPKMIDSILTRAIKKRHDNFDKDYPDFLMTFASRLKSGMNSLTAMMSVVDSLDSDSILRAELILMTERIRLGYQEDQAINAFGETVPHSEIELFVQALVLNRKVGGNLSDTIEGLATKVRKRQEFRKKAVSSVAEQRGGAVIVALIMGFLLFVMYQSSPALFDAVFESDTAMFVFQTGFSVSVFGFWLVRIITNIKV